jgi:hypothetical protein
MGVTTGKMAFQPNIVTNGLVLNLDAINPNSYPQSGTIWYDTSGYGNNGTLINGTAWTPNGSQTSFSFDGVDDYVARNLSAFNVGSFSIWLNPNTLINSGSSFQSIILLKYTGVANTEWYVALGSSTVYFASEYITLGDVANDTRTVIDDGGSLSANTWYNLLFNLESGTYKIYLNGVKKTETTRGGGVQQLTTPNLIQLGAFVRDTIIQGPFSGKIANTLIYNRALSSAEIQQNYNALKTRFGLS